MLARVDEDLRVLSSHDMRQEALQVGYLPVYEGS